MHKKIKREITISQRLIKFALHMYKQLTREQRYTIYILLQKKTSKKEIAEAINVHPSTITRELARNSGTNGKYNWETAEQNAKYHKKRKPGNHAVKSDVKEKALKYLKEEQWSPVQISGYLAKNNQYISHETIYRIIRRDKAAGGDLYKNCRHRLKHRA